MARSAIIRAERACRLASNQPLPTCTYDEEPVQDLRDRISSLASNFATFMDTTPLPSADQDTTTFHSIRRARSCGALQRNPHLIQRRTARSTSPEHAPPPPNQLVYHHLLPVIPSYPPPTHSYTTSTPLPIIPVITLPSTAHPLPPCTTTMSGTMATIQTPNGMPHVTTRQQEGLTGDHAPDTAQPSDSILSSAVGFHSDINHGASTG